MYCTRCGNQTGELDKFCGQCGNLASAVASSSSYQASAQPQAQFVSAPSHQLTRSVRSRRIAGVCAGIGRHFGVDPTVVRVLFLAMFFCPVLPAIIPYIVCWFVMPLEQPEHLVQMANSYPVPTNQPFAPMAR